MEKLEMIYFCASFVCAVIYLIGYIIYLSKGMAKEDDSIIIFLHLTGGSIAVFFLSGIALLFCLFFVLPAFIIHLIRRKPIKDFMS